MKKTRLAQLFAAITILSSCVSPAYYQVYSVKSNQDSIKKSDNLYFEDDNCKISYNLWANGGNIGFDFYNKTNETIYLNLKESTFILNGYAYDYFMNRTFTTSESKSASTSQTNTGSVAVTGTNIYNNIQTNRVQTTNAANTAASIGYSVSIKEDSIVSIPSKTAKRIAEFEINNTLIRDCDLFKYPSRKNIKSKAFSAAESPIVFSNIITYILNEEEVSVKNEFHVSEITNCPATEFFDYQYEEYCGQKSMSKTRYYMFYATDKFYIKYNKGQDYWKH